MMAPLETVVLDGRSLAVDDVVAVAAAGAPVHLSPTARARMEHTRSIVDGIVARREVVYGVTTGFGKLSEIAIPVDRLTDLQVNLIRSHAAGVGPLMPKREVRAMMLLRANVLASAYAGVRPALVELLIGMLNADLLPPIPEQGSVGASGDLAPLSHLALGLIGESTLSCNGDSGPAGRMLAAAGLAPVILGPKEGISLVNGTQAHTGIAALALIDARRLW